MTSPTNPMSTSAQRQHAVTIAGIDGVWATATGGDSSVSVAESWNGGAKVPDITLGRKVVGNVTVDRPFSSQRDRAVCRLIENLMGTAWSTTITDQDLDANDQAIGDPVVYTGCTPIKITPPVYDTEKADGSRVSIEFRVQSKV